MNIIRHAKYAVNSLKRNRTYTFINIVGLTLGMSIAIALATIITGLSDLDQFHRKKEVIFKLIHADDFTTNEYYDATSALMAPVVKNEIPGVVDYCRYLWANDKTLGSPENHVHEDGYYADEGWFRMFSFPLVFGNVEHVLSRKDNIAISHKLSLKLFGDINPVGRQVNLYSYELEKPEIFTVSGVFEDVPLYSSLQFEFIVPFEHFLGQHPYLKSWGNIGTRSYIQVEPNTNTKVLSEKITDLVREKHEHMQKNEVFSLAPLHKSNQLIYKLSGEPSFGFFILIAMGMIGISILVISVINYVNLSVATAFKRSKEIGVRKISGAGRKELIVQFLFESSIVVIISGILASFIQIYTINSFMTDPQPLTFFFNQTFLKIFVSVAIFTILVTTWFPAVYMSKFSPLRIRDISFNGKPGLSFSKRFLVAFQFFAAIILITTSVILSNQVDFLVEKSMGEDKYHIVYLTKNKQLEQSRGAFTSELQKRPGIVSATYADQLPFSIGNSTTSIQWEEKDPTRHVWYSYINVGENFAKTMNLRILKGNDFSTNDRLKVIVNESAVKTMNVENPVGKFITINGDRLQIIGVIKNFNFQFMSSPNQPLFIRYQPEYTQMAIVRFEKEAETTGLESLADVFHDFCPDFILDYTFLDQEFNERYSPIKKMKNVMTIAGFLAVVIACLGLLGLTAHTTQRRIKELGIRKINGAVTKDLIALLSNQVFKSVLIAALVANPLVFLLNKIILENFAERIEIRFLHFAWSMFLLFGLITITVGWQVLRAATRNPVEALRYE